MNRPIQPIAYQNPHIEAKRLRAEWRSALNAVALVNLPILMVTGLAVLAALFDDDGDFGPLAKLVLLSLFGISLGLMVLWMIFSLRDWRRRMNAR